MYAVVRTGGKQVRVTPGSSVRVEKLAGDVGDPGAFDQVLLVGGGGETRVGQGRTYVQLGQVEKVDFATWCEGLARGRGYVSDGYAHALGFTVEGQSSGGGVRLAQSGRV